ncbi:MAG: hypothetical protein WC208_15610 [Gallionella sp.]|jgi:dCMP deaminase
MKRPEKELYYLRIAAAILARGTCLRRNYGAVIVNNDQIVCTGYTGSPRGDANCCDQGTCRREEIGAAPGERYDLCNSVHAEMNAIISAGRDRCIGAIIYVVGQEVKSGKYIGTEPCHLCTRMIKNAGIHAAVVPTENFNTFLTIGGYDAERIRSTVIY